MARSRPSSGRTGRHLLRSASLARQLVHSAGIDPAHLVLEIGAGTGVLTDALAEQAARVVAVELDPLGTDRLRERFRGTSHVTVVEADALHLELPREPFRVVANPPFHITTALLHRLLDDPRTPLLRADLVVQLGAALKRTRDRNLLNASWGPWYTMSLVRTLPRTCFRPPPSVDGAHLAIVRRRAPLVPEEFRTAYVEMLRRAFTPACGPLTRELRVAPAVLRRCGIRAEATALDLGVEAWATVFGVLSHRREVSGAYVPKSSLRKRPPGAML